MNKRSLVNKKPFLAFLILAAVTMAMFILSIAFSTHQLAEPWRNFGMQMWGLSFIFMGLSFRINIFPDWMLRERPKLRVVEVSERTRPWSSSLLIIMGFLMIVVYSLWL